MLVGITRRDVALQKDSLLFTSEDKETGRTENDKLADRLTDVAKEYKQFYDWSEKFFKASPLAALIGEVAGLALAIGMNHGATLPFLSPKVQA